MTTKEIEALMMPVCDLVKQVCKKDKNFSIIISNIENTVSIQTDIEDAVADRATIYAIHSTCFYTLSQYEDIKRISFIHAKGQMECTCIVDFHEIEGCIPLEYTSHKWTSIRIEL